VCQCAQGFTGNPKDRTGCIALKRDQCQSDAQCQENEVCLPDDERNRCVSVCDTVKCGPGAVCVANNHAAQCKCPSGKFKGDPNDVKQGCVEVPCVVSQNAFHTNINNRSNE
jgi:hypothetical protein